MNNVRGLYYFIYWNILLLTSFRRVDGFPPEEIKDRIQKFPNEENNTVEGEFRWFYETELEKTLLRFRSSLIKLRDKAKTYLSAVRLFGEPSIIEVITGMKNFLLAMLTLKTKSDLQNLCNQVWAKYSDGRTGSVAFANILHIPLYEHRTPQETLVELPVLYCINQEIPNFKFFIVVFEDDDNPVEDSLFIYGFETMTSTEFHLRGYMYKIFQDRTDGNINKNETEIRRSK